MVAICHSHQPLLVLGNGGTVLANIGINASPQQSQRM